MVVAALQQDMEDQLLAMQMQDEEQRGTTDGRTTRAEAEGAPRRH